MKKIVLILIFLAVFTGSCAYFTSKEVVKIESKELRDRVDVLETEVVTLKLDLAIVRAEVENMSFRIVQVYEAILDRNPKVDRSVAFKIAQTVVIVSDGYGIDHWLVIAIMEKESNFNPRAKSYMGARGLMQVMPFWADDYGVRVSDLYDIETNIDVGIGILDFYLDECGWDVLCALGKYHGSYPKRGRGSYAYDVYYVKYQCFLDKYNKGKPFFEPLPFEDDIDVGVSDGET